MKSVRNIKTPTLEAMNVSYGDWEISTSKLLSPLWLRDLYATSHRMETKYINVSEILELNALESGTRVGLERGLESGT